MSFEPELFARRRAAFLDAAGAGAAVFPAAPVAIRNNDVEHTYRQDSDFYYLTGFDEPGSLLVLSNVGEEPQSVLFVRPRDEDRAIWDGPRAGVEGAVERFGVDAAFPIDELESRLPGYLENVHRLHYRIGHDAEMDGVVLGAIDAIRPKARRGIAHPREIVDPGVSLHELRLHKQPEELEAMRRAVEITKLAHLRALEVARPGRYEYEVEAEILHVFRRKGSKRAAYDSIVGSGPNATILHYVLNERKMEAGDLVLIDAGCELDFYASDVTRTFPVSGRFSSEQRALYDVCLAAQEAAIEAVRPGVTMEAVHQVAVGIIVDGLLELGLLKGEREEVLKDESYKAFFMHRTGHFLGMDVHDVGELYLDGEMRPLEPSMVITIEPGIYVGVGADVEPRWRGIGIRIEDDLLVTADGYENLTAAIPKAPDELESILANRS